jgi:gas vesicle protein
MVGLGLLLLLLSGGLAAAVALSNTDSTSAEAFGYSLANLTTGGLFLFGALTGLVFGLGLAMMIAGAGRRRTRRRGLKSQVKAVRSERESLAEENARLQEELERERTTRVTPMSDDVYPVEDAKHARTDETAGRGGMFRR